MEIDVNSVCNKNIPGGIDSVLVVMALVEIDVNTVCNKHPWCYRQCDSGDGTHGDSRQQCLQQKHPWWYRQCVSGDGTRGDRC